MLGDGCCEIQESVDAWLLEEKIPYLSQAKSVAESLRQVTAEEGGNFCTKKTKVMGEVGIWGRGSPRIGS